MKVYLIKEEDLEALRAAVDRDPRHGSRGGSSQVLSQAEEEAHLKAHRFLNYQIQSWIAQVKK